MNRSSLKSNIWYIDQGSLRGNPEYGRYTKEDLRDIINTWSMFGTDALCKKVKSGWIVDFRGFGFPVVFKTKHEAIKRADQWVDALVKLKREGLQKNPTKLNLHHCHQADKEHRNSKRQYAHVGHHKGAICVADAFFDLPHEHYCAILIHEIGHLLGGNTEAKADQMIEKKYGVKMQYKNSKYGDKLEYLPRNEIKKVLGVII